MLHLDLEDAIVYTYIDCFQLHRRLKSQANLISRQDHAGDMLNLKQFMRIKSRGTRCKYSFKSTYVEVVSSTI
jgi:hypothetical protein